MSFKYRRLSDVLSSFPAQNPSFSKFCSSAGTPAGISPVASFSVVPEIESLVLITRSGDIAVLPLHKEPATVRKILAIESFHFIGEL
jgi:hypothetical protein